MESRLVANGINERGQGGTQGQEMKSVACEGGRSDCVFGNLCPYDKGGSRKVLGGLKGGVGWGMDIHHQRQKGRCGGIV